LIFDLGFMIWKGNTVVCLIIGVISHFLLISCSPYRQSKIAEYHERLVPPNCIEISDNYFVDKSDIKNIDYLEFMFWNERIFGYNSQEYQSILPDSVKKHIPDSTYAGMLTRFYAGIMPETLELPLSNISDQQFRLYTAWRTDRVYEMMLSRFSILDYDTAQKAGHYFTIEYYYNGIYSGSIPDTILAYIPIYSIPAQEEILVIKQNKTFNRKIKSPWTGYRNVCRWERIGK